MAKKIVVVSDELRAYNNREDSRFGPNVRSPEANRENVLAWTREHVSSTRAGFFEVSNTTKVIIR